MRTSILYLFLLLLPFFISAQYDNCDDALSNRTCGIDQDFEINMGDIGPFLYTFLASDTEVEIDWELTSIEFGDLCISLYENCEDSPISVSNGNTTDFATYSLLLEDLEIGESYTIGIEGCYNDLPVANGSIYMDNSGDQETYFVELNTPVGANTGFAANAFCTGSTVYFSMKDAFQDYKYQEWTIDYELGPNNIDILWTNGDNQGTEDFIVLDDSPAELSIVFFESGDYEICLININKICGDTEPDCVDITINNTEEFLGTFDICISDIYDGWKPSNAWNGAPITAEDLKDFNLLHEDIYSFQVVSKSGECNSTKEINVRVGNENSGVCDDYTPIEVCPQWENNLTVAVGNESAVSATNVIQLEGEETITISTTELNLPDQAYIEWYSSKDSNFVPGQSGDFLGSSQVFSNWNACNRAAETLAIQYNGDRSLQSDSPEDEYIVIGSGSGFYVDDLQLITENNCDSSCPTDCATNYGNVCGWRDDHFKDTQCDNIISVGSGDFIPPNALVFVFLGTEAIQRNEGYEMLCQLESCVYVMMNNCERCLEAFKNDNSNSNYGIITSCGGMSTIQYNATRSTEAGSFATKDGLVGFNFYSIPSVLPSDYLIEASVQDLSFSLACNNSTDITYVRGIIKSDLYNVDCCSPYTPTITFEQSCPTLPPPNGSTLLDDYPWLPALVNQNDCDGIEITEYTFGSVTFIYIKEGDLGILYYQDGQKYCMDAPGFDCISAYSLVEETGSWKCDEVPGPPNPDVSIYTDFPWLIDYVDVNNCLGTVIYFYEFFGSTFPFFEVDGQRTLFSDLGQVYCTDNPPHFSCADAYGLDELVSFWECGQDCICTAEYDPVCGTDGNTYGNECEAACAGVDVEYYGVCNDTLLLDPLFIAFPWLLDVVSPLDCGPDTYVGLFQVGTFQYIYISETGSIYNDSGHLYCQDYPGFSCSEFYELTPANFIQGWECGTLVSSPESLAFRTHHLDNASSHLLSIAKGLSTRVEQHYTSELDFKLYPNPAHNQVTLETTESYYHYRILDITGQTLMSSMDAIHGSHTINLDQEPGVYLVELYNEKEHKTQKLIIAE